MRKFLKFFEKKENPVGRSYAVIGGSNYVFKTDKKAFAIEGYQQNIIVYKAIKKIVDSVCSIKLLVEKNGEILKDHEVFRLLEDPNPQQGYGEFMENLFTDYLITGEIAIVKDNPNKPVEMWPLNPLYLEVVAGSGGMPAEYIYNLNNVKTRFEVDLLTGKSRVFFHKMYNPLNYWRGQAPLQACALAADTHNAGLRWNYELLDNGGRPSGILKLASEPSQADMNRLREYFKKSFQGSKNAGEIPILNEGEDFTELGNNPRDMDYISTLKECAKYVANAFDVPLQLIDNSASTFSNMSEAKEMLWTDAVLPVFNKFLESFNKWLMSEYGEGLKLVPDYDSIPALEGMRTRKFERMIKAKEAGVITVDEVRSELGWTPRGGMADVLMVDGGKIPIEMVGEDEESSLKALGYTSHEIKSIMDIKGE